MMWFFAVWLSAAASSDVAFLPHADNVQRLTHKEGCEEFPSFTPDAKTIIFDGFVDSGYGIFSLDLASKKTRRLTQQKEDYWQYSDDWDYGATLSPDAKLIAYLHDTADGTELRTIPVAGDASAAPTIIAEVRDNEPAWVGERAIVALDANDDAARFDLGPPVKKHVIARLDKEYVGYGFIPFSDGGFFSRVLLGNSPMLDWSILVPKNGVFSRLPLDAAKHTVGEFRFKGGAPSADDHAFYQTVGNQLDDAQLVWRLREGGEAHAVPGITRAAMGFSISRDRHALVYSDCYSYYQLVRFRSHGEMVELLPRSASQSALFPRSFGTHSLLFSRTEGGASDIMLFDLASKNVSTFLHDGSDAVVSHDRQRVAFADQKKGGIAVLAPARGPQRVALTTALDDHRPEWTHGDDAIVFLRGAIDRKGGAKLYIVAASGGAVRALGPDHVGAFAVSPVMDRIIYYAQDKKRLFEMSASGGKPHAILASQPRVSFEDLRFTSDGRALLAVAEQKRLLRIDLDAEKETMVATSGFAGMDNVDAAPDHDGYIAGVRIWDGDLWLATGEFP